MMRLSCPTIMVVTGSLTLKTDEIASTVLSSLVGISARTADSHVGLDHVLGL